MAQFFLIGICSKKGLMKPVETSIRLSGKNSRVIANVEIQLSICGDGAKGNQR